MFPLTRVPRRRRICRLPRPPHATNPFQTIRRRDRQPPLVHNATADTHLFSPARESSNRVCQDSIIHVWKAHLYSVESLSAAVQVPGQYLQNTKQIQSISARPSLNEQPIRPP